MIDLHVLGIGSPFGDDQLGWEVIQLLQQRAELQHFIPDRLALTYCDRPGLGLIDLMRDANTVFLIDAVVSGAPIGTLHQVQNKDIETLISPLSTHAFGVAQAMTLGAALNALPKTVILYGIEISAVITPFEKSPPIVEAIQLVTTRMAQDIVLRLVEGTTE